MSGLNEKGIDLLSGLLMGGDDNNEDSENKEENYKIHLDMDKIKNMSDEQRMELYNTIISSVMGTK